jgi:hypothetical protein
METEGPQEKKEDIISHLADYADTFYRLTILKLTQKATQIASAIIVVIAMCVFGLFVLLFASIGAAWWLGNIINSRAGGFMIMAGFYFLLVLCIILFRRKIIFPYIRNIIIKKFYD